MSEQLFNSLTTAIAWSTPAKSSTIFVFADMAERDRARNVATSRLSGSLCGTYDEMTNVLSGMRMEPTVGIAGVVIDVDSLPDPSCLPRLLDRLAQMPVVTCVLSSWTHRDLCRATNSWERRTACFDFYA